MMSLSSHGQDLAVSLLSGIFKTLHIGFGDCAMIKIKQTGEP